METRRSRKRKLDQETNNLVNVDNVELEFAKRTSMEDVNINTKEDEEEEGEGEEKEGDDNGFTVTVEEITGSIFKVQGVEQDTRFVKYLQVNTLSSCIFCLRRTSRLSSKVSSLELLEGNDSDLEVVPRPDHVHSSSPTLLHSFNRIWAYVVGMETESKIGQDDEDLLNVNNLLSEKTSFHDLPRMCHFCLDELKTIDELFRNLKLHLDAIGGIVQDSKYGGKYSWRAEQFEQTLNNSSLEPDVVNETITVLNFLGKKSAIHTIDTKHSPDSFLPDPDESRASKFIRDDTEKEKYLAGETAECNKSDAKERIKSEPGDSEVADGDDRQEWVSSLSDVSYQTDDNDTDISDDDTAPTENIIIVNKNILKFSEVRPEPELPENITFLFAVNPDTKEEKFSCTIDTCNAFFSQLKDLKDHLAEKHKIHCAPDSFKCNVCHKYFGPIARVRLHTQKSHLRAPVCGTVQTCDLCAAEVPVTDIYEHVRAHVGDEYIIPCPSPLCPNTYTRIRSVHNHLKYYSKRCYESIPNIQEVLETINSIACKVCGHKALNFGILRKHLNRFHETSEKNFSCPINKCLRQFTIKQSVELHLHQHDFRTTFSVKHIQTCVECRRKIKVGEMEQHLRKFHEHGVKNITKCTRCPFVFASREHFVNHLYVHRHNAVLSCDLCGDKFQFSTYLSLRKHYFKVHQIGQEYMCEHCSHVSYTPQLLLSHVKSHNVRSTRDDPSQRSKLKTYLRQRFKCDSCDVVYKARSNLTDHKIREHGAEPYRCKYCKETFQKRKLFLNHEKEHAGESLEEKVFTCDEEGCGKVFKKNWELRNHIASVHQKERHKCDVCGKSYRSKHALKSHVNFVHLGLRPYVCDTCGEKFATGAILQNHKLIHTGDRPFACEICGQMFRHKEVLRKHIEGHQKKGADFKPNGPMKQIRKRVKKKVQS